MLNGRKIACYQIKNIGFDIDFMPRKMLFFVPEVLQNGQKFEASINI